MNLSVIHADGKGLGMDSPFLRLDDPGIPAVLTDATVNVLGARGIDRFSVRALARWMKTTPAAVLNNYSRARVLEIVIITFERRWLEWSGSEPMYGPNPAQVPLRLPATPDECLGVRVHSALQQLAEAERLRDHPASTAHLERLRDEELELLRFRLEGQRADCCQERFAERDVLGIMAMVTGLRLALADPSPALTWEDACAALRDHTASATVHSSACRVDRRAG
jgi:hypothetical protein